MITLTYLENYSYDPSLVRGGGGDSVWDLVGVCGGRKMKAKRSQNRLSKKRKKSHISKPKWRNYRKFYKPKSEKVADFFRSKRKIVNFLYFKRYDYILKGKTGIICNF